jgi:predicted O-linked N-acetylglucosamine transferase (SPINDLY family)/Tfp pilus assembly protein PilF
MAAITYCLNERIKGKNCTSSNQRHPFRILLFTFGVLCLTQAARQSFAAEEESRQSGNQGEKVGQRHRRSEHDIANHGLKLMRSGRYDLGLQEYQAGLAWYPNSSLLALSVADAYAFQNRYGEALDAYHKALSAAREASVASATQGEYESGTSPASTTPDSRTEDDQQIKAYITKAITWIGVCHRRMGQTALAIEWLAKAVEHNRQEEDIQTRESRYHLAFSCYLDNRFVDAARWMGETMKIAQVADDYEMLFVLLGVLEHWNLLAALLERCVHGKCDFPKDYTIHRAFLHYAGALSASGRVDEATKALLELKSLTGSPLEESRADVQANLDMLRLKAAQVKDAPSATIDLHLLRRELSDLYQPLLRSTEKDPTWSIIHQRHVKRFQWPIPDALAAQAKATLKLQGEIFASSGSTASPIFDDMVEMFTCLAIPLYDLKDCILSARVYANRRIQSSQSEGVRVMGYNDFQRSEFPSLSSSNPLHIGLFSGDVRGHPMLSLLHAFVRRTHEMPDVRVTLYHAGEDPVVLDEVRPYVDATKKCYKVNYVDCLNHARQSRVQVWLETTGSTGEGVHHIVLAGPAPVGVLWAGFPGSMAAPDTLQYMVSDTYTVPPHSDFAELYPEKMLYVPGSWMISDTTNLDEAMAVPHATLANTSYTRVSLRAYFGIPLDAVVYCYFGRTEKVDDRVYGAWGDIHEQVPNSYLVVAYYSTDSTIDPNRILDSMRAAWTGMGLPLSRFAAVPPFRRGEHIAVMRELCDVSLDTLTYGGGTTSFEALYAGLPLVHFSDGHKMMQRAGGSILVASGLGGDLIASSLDEYVDIAVRLGTDRGYRQGLRQHLEDIRTRRKPSELFSPETGIDAMVRGMKVAYELWKDGKPPETIHLENETRSEEAKTYTQFTSSEL